MIHIGVLLPAELSSGVHQSAERSPGDDSLRVQLQEAKREAEVCLVHHIRHILRRL